MNQKELLQIKERLEKQKREINLQILELAEKDPRGQNNYEAKFPQFGSSEDENVDEVEDFSNLLPLKIGLEESLVAIEDTLSRIDGGKYGFCESCGKEISVNRLKVVPTARLCLNCEKKLKS